MINLKILQDSFAVITDEVGAEVLFAPEGYPIAIRADADHYMLDKLPESSNIRALEFLENRVSLKISSEAMSYLTLSFGDGT